MSSTQHAGDFPTSMQGYTQDELDAAIGLAMLKTYPNIASEPQVPKITVHEYSAWKNSGIKGYWAYAATTSKTQGTSSGNAMDTTG